MTPTPNPENEPVGPRRRVLWLSTFAFTLLFAVWLMLGVLGIKIREELSLSPAQFDWLLAVAILAGALPRLHFGILADKFGGRNVMIALLLFTAVPTYLVSQATTYLELMVCAALFGLAGNSFTVGIAWTSAWFPARSKGTALGVFGAGNVGASGTKLLVVLMPGVLTLIPIGGYLGGVIPGGWRFVPVLYAAMLLLTAGGLAVWCPRVDHKPGRGRAMRDLLRPLAFIRVWRLSLYYVVVFGAYVALSAWLPSYYRAAFGLDLRTAALLTALYIFPASLLRPFGGWLSDRYGPRVVTYSVFLVMTVALVPLCLPSGVLNLGVVGFTVLMVVVGCGMGIGKASVYKYVPDYYPNDVGAVGGLVGALGAVGGFALPPIFGILARETGSPQAAFLALLALTLGSLVWLHVAVLRIKAAARIGRPLSEPALATATG
jgi:NNP family nitrate/nitrite transporter-like MFS transporter